MVRDGQYLCIHSKSGFLRVVWRREFIITWTKISVSRGVLMVTWKIEVKLWGSISSAAVEPCRCDRVKNRDLICDSERMKRVM